MFGESDIKHNQQTLNSPLIEDDENVRMKDESNYDTLSVVRRMVSGDYTYLTYMLLSTTCFFFWAMPNCHKMRKFFTTEKSK